MLVGACGADDAPGPRRPGVSREDIAALNEALAFEHLEAGFYAQAAQATTAHAASERELLQRFAAQEAEHVATLTRNIRDAGGRPVAAGPSAAARSATRWRPRWRSRSCGRPRTWISWARIANAGLLAVALSIHAVEARQAVALRGLTGRLPGPPEALGEPLAARHGDRARAGAAGVNRRALLLRAALLSLAAPAAPAFAQGIDDPATANDAEVLNFALQLEELQASLYRAALELDLGPGLRSLVNEYAAHGREHVELLTGELRKLGAEPEDAPAVRLRARGPRRLPARGAAGRGHRRRRVQRRDPGRALELRPRPAGADRARRGPARGELRLVGRPAAPESFDAVLSQTVVVQRIERYVRA